MEEDLDLDLDMKMNAFPCKQTTLNYTTSVF